MGYAVVRAGRRAKEKVRLKAASYFAKRCGGAPRDLEACYNLAVMHYNGSANGGRDKASNVVQDACSAGYPDACPMVTEIDAQRAHAARAAEADARGMGGTTRKRGRGGDVAAVPPLNVAAAYRHPS